MNKWIETVLHKAMEEYADQYEQMAGKDALAEAMTSNPPYERKAMLG